MNIKRKIREIISMSEDKLASKKEKKTNFNYFIIIIILYL